MGLVRHERWLARGRGIVNERSSPTDCLHKYKWYGKNGYISGHRIYGVRLTELFDASICEVKMANCPVLQDFYRYFNEVESVSE
jgi:hypothetical protein